MASLIRSKSYPSYEPQGELLRMNPRYAVDLKPGEVLVRPVSPAAFIPENQAQASTKSAEGETSSEDIAQKVTKIQAIARGKNVRKKAKKALLLLPFNQKEWDSLLFKRTHNQHDPVNRTAKGTTIPLETFVSLKIKRDSFLLPNGTDEDDNLSALWDFPDRSTGITCAFVVLNKTIIFGFCSKKYGTVGGVKSSVSRMHCETEVMCALVKAVINNTINIHNLRSIDVYSTLQPCAMCSIVIYKAVQWLIKKKGSVISCRVFFYTTR